MALKRGLNRKKVPGATSPRRHKADAKRQLKELDDGFFPGQDIEDDMTRRIDRPDKVAAYRRVMLGFALAEAERSRPVVARLA
ncbi:MAG TPA: hypothetical protein VEA92_00780 [Candidatus Paceibacterota bacterium]|nr:hypothetical protein [Candidatus Paceibacterota bacterium]